MLPINQNQALFAILGTTYGGDGRTTFALPDFRGRTAIHQGNGRLEGQAAGEEFHTLAQTEMPGHTHLVQGINANANKDTPVGNFLANIATFAYRANPSNLTTLNPTVVTNFGGSQPHENRQPFLVLAFIIALTGIFPSRN